jgi:1-phosphofructokinase family hexose kinase
MILCIGTTPTLQRTMVFDQLRIDEVNRARQVREYASGKSINVARVLRELGEEALAVGICGGKRGEALRDDLNAIPHELIPTGAQTRLCTTLIDQSTGQVTELVEEAPPVTSQELGALEEVIAKYARSARVIVFSGTLAPRVSADFCARYIDGTKPVIVDAKGEPMRLAMQKPRCIAKLNRDELEQTIGQPLSPEALRRYTPTGGMILVTLGKDGAIASNSRHIYRIHSPTISAVSPIGSGDAVAAGLAAGIVRGLFIEQQLCLAVACGAANALTADSGHLHRADVDRLINQIRIDRID